MFMQHTIHYTLYVIRFTAIWGLIAIMTVYLWRHLSSFTYSAMKLLEHDIHPRCAMRSACGNSVMARYARKNELLSQTRERKQYLRWLIFANNSAAQRVFRESFWRHIRRRRDLRARAPPAHVRREYKLTAATHCASAHHKISLRSYKCTSFAFPLPHPLRVFWNVIWDVFPIRETLHSEKQKCNWKVKKALRVQRSWDIVR